MLPRVKQYKKTEGIFSSAPVFPMTEDGAAAARVLSLFLPTMEGKTGKDATVSLVDSAFSVKGAYTLSVLPSRVTVTYGDYEGLRNAVATLASLRTEEGFSCAEITDAPEYPHRSALLDLARGYVEMPILREHIVRMARLKYNYVHLHLMDAESYAMESEVVPNPGGHRQHTREAFRELCAFARDLAIEVIPEIEFPTHATNLLRACPEIACDIIDRAKADAIVAVPLANKKFLVSEDGPLGWGVCLGNEKTYALYRRILEEVASVFPGEYIHIGGDEISLPVLGLDPHWNNCRLCTARMRERGHADPLALYYDGICRIHEMVKALGKRTIKWNDQWEMAAPPAIPRDIIYEYWKTSNPGFQDLPPEEVEADMRRLEEAGFTVINAHIFSTYNDQNHYMTAEKMNTWSPAPRGGSRIGGETCAWELGNLPTYAYLACRLPLAMALMADRLWNRDSVPYDGAYRTAMFSAILGRSGLGEAPLAPLPDLLIPVPHSNTPPPTVSPEEAPAALAALSSVDRREVYGSLFLDAYRTYLEGLLEK